MKCKIATAIAGTALALGVMSASAVADANPVGGGDCHAVRLQNFKTEAGANSAESTADFYNVTVKFGQEFISASCGKS
jgi:hypothetical protein